jgi:ribosomal protein S21
LSKTVNIKVEIGGRIRTSDQLIKVFIRKCKKEKIVQEYRETLVFETKSQKKRRKKREGKSRHERDKRKKTIT